MFRRANCPVMGNALPSVSPHITATSICFLRYVAFNAATYWQILYILINQLLLQNF